MAIALRSSTSSGADTFANSKVVAVPAGAAIDDIAILTVETWTSGAEPTVSNWNGFTEITGAHTTMVTTSSPGNQSIRKAYKRLTAGDTGNYTVNFSATTWNAVDCEMWSGGLASGDPIEASNTATASTGYPTTTVAPATAAGISNSAGTTNAITTTAPTNFTEQQDHDTIHTNTRVLASGATVTASGGTVSANTEICVSMIAIKPAASGAATPTPAAVAAVTALPLAVPSVTDVAAPAAVTAVAALPLAVPSVADSGTPATVTAVTTLPQATVTGNATVTPGVITAVAALPAAGISVSAVPAAVAAVAGLPTPSALAGGNISVSPPAVAAVVALPDSTRLLGATVSPGVIVTVAALPRAAVGVTVGPASIAVLTSLPTAVPVTSSSVTRTPATIAASIAVLTPHASAEGAGMRGRIGELSPRSAGGVVTPRTFELGGTIR